MKYLTCKPDQNLSEKVLIFERLKIPENTLTKADFSWAMKGFLRNFM